MSARRALAVLRIKKPTEHEKLCSLARVVVNDIAVNNSIFPNPDPPLAEMAAQIKLVCHFAAKVYTSDFSQIEMRNKESRVLHDMLRQQLIYVNSIGKGNAVILGLSGYHVIQEQLPRPTPPKVVIRKIVDTFPSHSAKIIIFRLGMSPVMYKIQMNDSNNNEEGWSIVHTTGSSFDLVIHNMIRGKEVWFRVNAQNAAGDGLWSEPHSFIPR